MPNRHRLALRQSLAIMLFLLGLPAVAEDSIRPGQPDSGLAIIECSDRYSEREIVLAVVEFSAGSHALMKDARHQVSGLARWLGGSTGWRVAIHAHCADGMTAAYAKVACSQRASAVKAALTKDGVAASRIFTVSHGLDSAQACFKNTALPKHNRLAAVTIFR